MGRSTRESGSSSSPTWSSWRARRLEARLEELGAGGTAVTLDLGGTEIISNAGLRMLVRCAGQATQRGRRCGC